MNKEKKKKRNVPKISKDCQIWSKLLNNIIRFVLVNTISIMLLSILIDIFIFFKLFITTRTIVI